MFPRPLSLICLLLVLAMPAAHAVPDDWSAPQEPVRIFANTWYVGSHGLSVILVDTGDGLVLFDGGLPTSPPMIEKHVRALGYRVEDIKWILNSHAHYDHAGGIAALAAASGAQVLASKAGAHELELGGADRADPQFGSIRDYTPVKNVRVVGDGQAVQLGNVAITARYTPGHTPGSTTWTWTVCEGKRCLHMVYADSLTAISAPDFRFSDHPGYVEAFRHALATVAALPCDILLTPHPGASGFWKRMAQRKSDTDVDPLVDTSACRAYAAASAEKLDARLAHERAEAGK